MAIQQFYTPKKLYTPKTNFWLCPWDHSVAIKLNIKHQVPALHVLKMLLSTLGINTGK